MNDFLKKLSESLNSDTPDKAIAAKFEEINTKAKEIEIDSEKVEELEEKMSKAQKARQPLTAEEIKELEFVAMKQQQKIDEFEFNVKLGATLVNIDLMIEKLTNKVSDFKSASLKLRDESISIREKNVLIKDVLKDINTLESPIANFKK